MELNVFANEERGESNVNAESMVSKKSEENNEEVEEDLEEEDDMIKNSISAQVDVMCDQGVEAYHDFMPMYQGLCRTADASGKQWLVIRNILRKGFNAMRSDINRAVSGTECTSENTSGIVSLPELCKRRKAKRRTKVTSPARRGKKKK